MKVYADNAATTRISDTAFDAMAPYFKELYGNPSSLYTLGQLSQEALYSARETVAKCLNCDMKEITFTSGGVKLIIRLYSQARIWARQRVKST